mmetsp:Transcript_21357/g.43945  ORF Transcript_21357/g.43945 Transcript_21357/m.43945 type:complete len:333 (-) Transcript_21357:114-1112(-)
MNSVVSIAARRWPRNATAASRVGGIVRQRLFMGITASASDENNLQRRNFSSGDDVPSGFAAVDHSKAYERAMEGRHGQQLSLARLEGIGKDDLPFDPFEEEEKRFLEEELMAAEDDGESEDSSDSDSDSGSDSESEWDSDDEEDEGHTSSYNTDGSVRRKKSVLATLKAGYPSGGLFCVLELAGSQHKVTIDDLLVINKLKPVEEFKVGSVHTLKDVLLVGSSHLTLVGMPHVSGAEVDVMVEEITQDAKVIIFKKRRRKHSQRKNGYRRDLTLLRVLDIRLPEEYKDHDHVGRDSVDDLETVSLETLNDEEEVSRFETQSNAEGEKMSSSQ